MPPRRRTRLLHVDLSTREVDSRPVPSAWRRAYLGGKGLGARYLLDELEPGTDPFAPENPLLFMLGPLSGILPGEPRYAAITKSPLTGAFLDSYAGGDFAGALAHTLDDHLGIMVTGRAADPVELVVENGTARIEHTDQWGADAVEMAQAHPDDAVACIGPAGEEQVAFATIASDEATHHAGRGGAGAVMGSKRLKALVVRGDNAEPTLDSRLDELYEETVERFTDGDTGRWLESSGTVETVDFANEVGALSTRGWQDTGFDGASAVGIGAVRAAATGRERTGRISGGFTVPTDDGETVPRGATAMSFGAGLDIEDFDAVTALGDRCNRLGIDLISAGNAIALAIRAANAGDIDADLSFGDPTAAEDLLEDISTRRTQLGDALADGVSAAAERLGTEEVVPTAKQLSLPGYDPRAASAMALAYATSNRGGCHRRARPIEQEVFDRPWSVSRAARIVCEEQNSRALRWSLIADDFLEDTLDVAAWLDAADVPYDSLDRAGERIWTLVRLFNVREGFDRQHDSLPRPFRPTAADSTHSLDALLDEYYERRGWSPDGRPRRETLETLDLLSDVDPAPERID